jgi:hypothetical protein
MLADGAMRSLVAAAFTSANEAVSDDAARLAHGVFLSNRVISTMTHRSRHD